LVNIAYGIRRHKATRKFFFFTKNINDVLVPRNRELITSAPIRVVKIFSSSEKPPCSLNTLLIEQMMQS